MANQREKRIAATKFAKKYGFQPTPVEPATSEVGDATYPGCEYTDEEREFLIAMERYQREAGRKFPTFCEVLKVVKALGYEKVRPSNSAPLGNRNVES